jgi:peptidoglycan hydrolase CwlO-like protein
MATRKKTVNTPLLRQSIKDKFSRIGDAADALKICKGTLSNIFTSASTSIETRKAMEKLGLDVSELSASINTSQRPVDVSMQRFHADDCTRTEQEIDELAERIYQRNLLKKRFEADHLVEGVGVRSVSRLDVMCGRVKQ